MVLGTAPAHAWRPFAPDSFWNSTLARSVPLDPSSAALVAELNRQVTWGTTVATTSYSVPIYNVPLGQKLVHVTLDTPAGDLDAPRLQAALDAVPIPTGARPAAGTDGHLVVYQERTETIWELFRAHLEPDGWHASWGARVLHQDTSPGYLAERSWGATATGLPLIGGLIRVAELQRGVINHAIAISIPLARYKYPSIFSWPAQRADGRYASVKAIPEGARFRLDPALDVDALGLPPVTAMIAKAAQRYGLVVRDQGGGVSFYAEDPGPLGSDPYPGLFGGLAPWRIASSFPWSRLQALPLAYDVTPPETTIESGPTGAVARSDASFAFSASEAESAFRCQLDAGAWERCSSAHTTSDLADGPHTLDVRAVDKAWNTDPTPAVRSWTVDTVAPASTITAGPAGATSSTTVDFDFTADERGVAFTCRLDAGAPAPCTAPQTYPDLPTGDHRFSVSATDAAGNTEAAPVGQDFAVDPAAASGWPDENAPETTIDDAPPSTTNSTSAAVGFAATEGDTTFACRLDEGAWAACTSPAAFSDLGESAHAIEVRATDRAGNQDPTPARADFVVDLTPPATTIDPSPPVTRSERVMVSFGADESGARFECRLDGGAWAAGCTSPGTFAQLADGSHIVAVRATDLAGNADPTPASTSFTVDTTAPRTTVSSPLPAYGISANAEFALSTDPGATTQCLLDQAAPVPCGGSVSFSGLAPGAHTFEAWSTDAAGNVESERQVFTWIVCTMLGTAGDDRLVGTPGDDVICGLGGNDAVSGGSGNDQLFGGDGTDVLRGDAGDDRLMGEGGADTLDGGTGADVLSGGAGSDAATYASRTAAVNVTIGGGTPDGETGEGDDVMGDTENVVGGAADDTLTGDAGGNFLAGGPGGDVLNGGDGPDTLDGGSGPDVLNGGPKADVVSYGARTAMQPVVATIDGQPASGGDLDGTPGHRDTIALDVESLRGGAGDDVLTGDDGPNTLNGGGGGDDLEGRGGTDVLRADEGQADRRIACDANPAVDDSADRAYLDDLDPAPLGCETVARAARVGG